MVGVREECLQTLQQLPRVPMGLSAEAVRDAGRRLEAVLSGTEHEHARSATHGLGEALRALAEADTCLTRAIEIGRRYAEPL